MAVVDLVMPKMGESIMEATILKWLKKPGDSIEEDETILEIATDKVDSEVPSPVSGVMGEVFFQEDDVVEVGKVIGTILTEGEEVAPSGAAPEKTTAPTSSSAPSSVATATTTAEVATPVAQKVASNDNGRFYSPLVRNIAKEENISMQELGQIAGSGKEGRVTKKDILAFISNRGDNVINTPAQATTSAKTSPKPTTVSVSGGDEIIEMTRMRKLIADHMTMSKQTSAHVTSFVEVDVTDIVNWRNGVKGDFKKKYGQNITFTPIFLEAVAKAIRDFPLINVSVDGNKIIRKNNINIGMAAALPSGNLIVPVIKNADNLNLLGMTKAVNDLAVRARENKLNPDEIQGGTFTVTNVGSFGNVMGTPIINQPQVAILATGAIRKKPGVVETPYGDLIAVRHMVFLSLSYDHRVVDGMLGGTFLRRVGDYLEQFDTTQEV